MEKEIISNLTSSFEQIAQREEDTNSEFWYARDLQKVLGYARWDSFSKVIDRATVSCVTSGLNTEDHFLEGVKIVSIGSGAERNISDIILSRYACYLIAQNGDPSKGEISFAQAYFALQTRKTELIEKRIEEVERINARKRLTSSEKELSSNIFGKLGDSASISRIRSKGDAALFGGNTTGDMKKKLDVPKGRPLADFLPVITIKAKDFANEITNFKLKEDAVNTEDEITLEHVLNNRDVRRLLKKRGISPEELPAEEDAKKLERRLASGEKKLLMGTERRKRKIEAGDK